ncbi:DNA polymerase alpha/epsilon subunit B-domain-containing protein [Crepidotus variabilis]|uniref:DNA polymerase alpha subunit B n=1 Tax=Crepidotus variabilis TaxID=179855 RepID=A0A9P6JVZ9_9AGAR|nr:DNA polymerase alpha/epsilon subunit B-domain-containing protein [Crepidotus variabilis]
MVSAPDIKTIETVFNDGGAMLDEKLAGECASICALYSLSAEDLLYKAQAINYKSSGTSSEITPVTMDTLIAIKKQLTQVHSTKPKAKTQLRNSLMTAQVDRSRLPNQKFAQKLPLTAVKQEYLGESSSSALGGLGSSAANVTFIGPKTGPADKKKRAYRYMYEKISERSTALDFIIDDFAELVKMHYNISELADPSVSTDDEVFIVGRITHDAEVAVSRLAEGAMMIESSRYICGGARIPLKLEPAIKVRAGVSGVGGFGLYPGAIAAFKGKNGGGGYFLATEYISMPPLKPSPAAQGIAPKPDPLAAETSASILLICGPFTADSDLSYRPWRELLKQIKGQEKRPDVLFLVGPFVDSAHPKIKNGDMDVSPSNLIKAHFVDLLKNYLAAWPKSIVVMVPSIRDLASDHAAFPQPELDAQLFGAHPQIHLLPNPARCIINDISFAVTSVDSLFHLRKEEYFKRGVEADSLTATPEDLSADPMANLCRHLLLQRSFYPIFPPPQELSSEINLDVSHSEGAQMIDPETEVDYAPDVLILPSRLKQFAKTIHSTITINPSYLSKGTYASITIAPRSSGQPKDRVKVEILKMETPVPVVAPLASTS